ncbi:hypothetical protein [Streptomyces sp. NPDC088725]|uniref:hypothetical protein n=1 Tax=Streptomyces sp. NPDC088725 TaxID=3365873 RepID=UPI00382FE836
MEVVILILVLIFAAFVALGVYVGVKTIGAARSAKLSVERGITQARRNVEDTTLRARSLGQPGIPGELAQLRVRLRTSMRATQDALHAGAAEDASLSESVGLFERLSVHGRELDDELKLMEREPDRARVARRLTELRERTEKITHSADSLRWAARDRALKFAEDDLSALSAEIDVESGALRHWSAADAPAAGPRADQPGAAPTWPEPSPAEGTRAGATQAEWPSAEGTAAEGPQPIGPPDSGRQGGYPWQKSPGATRPGSRKRPETTN